MIHQQQLTTSVALFSNPNQTAKVPITWLVRVERWFESLRLSPAMFTATGENFVADDCCLLGDGSGPTFRWDDPVPIWSRRSELVCALTRGEIDSLSIDVPREGGRSRSDWIVDTSFDPQKLFVGIDSDLEPNLSSLVTRSLQLSQDLCIVRYGFAYQKPLAEAPELYASGFKSSSVAEVLDFIRHRSEYPKPPTNDELWLQELYGQKRHLVDRFRDAYPLNVLSHDHVEAAGLKSQCLGRLSPLNDSLWLWELRDEELPEAHQLLATKGLLIASESPTD